LARSNSAGRGSPPARQPVLAKGRTCGPLAGPTGCDRGARCPHRARSPRLWPARWRGWRGLTGSVHPMRCAPRASPWHDAPTGFVDAGWTVLERWGNVEAAEKPRGNGGRRWGRPQGGRGGPWHAPGARRWREQKVGVRRPRT
jgi:hypothetical protein